jgi:chemotaxis protein methyltransferase WspC
MNLEPFGRILQRASGLVIRSVGGQAVTRMIEERMSVLGLKQPEEYEQRLEQDAEERQLLIEAAVIPETWFNRDSVAFEVLVKMTRDKLAKTPGVPVRILSVPSSTGEEAYSIVIALTAAGVDPANYVVEAVDISQNALAAAEKAEYRANSFRRCSEEFKLKYFTKPSEETWQLNPELRAPVKFRAGNLLVLESILQGEPYDFVFCRNLLIYFSRPDQGEALKHLRQILKPDGILFAGPGEGGIFLDQGYRTLRIPHAFAFRLAPPRPERPKLAEGQAKPAAQPAAEGAPAGEATEAAPAAEPALNPDGTPATPAKPAPLLPRGNQPRPSRDGRGPREPREPREQRDSQERREGQEPREGREPRPPREPREGRDQQPQSEGREPRPEREGREPRESREPREQNRDQKQAQKPKEQAPAKRASTPSDTVSVMEQIQKLADGNQLAEAEAKLRGLLAGGSSDPDAFYLMGLLQDAQNDNAGAVSTYRKVLYLDPNHHEAMTHLALLLESQGEKSEAERLHSRASRVQKGARPKPKIDA